MIETKRFSLVKPTIQTPFHIDFDWWKEHDNNWRVYLHSCLCTEHQAAFQSIDENFWVDWIDFETAEVIKVDGLQHILMTHCANQSDFLTTNTSLVDTTFRAFLAGGNNPLTPIEISRTIGRPAEIILRTFTSSQVYKGIRPCSS